MAFEKVGIQAVVEGLGAFNRGVRDINKGLQSIAKQQKEIGKQSQVMRKGMKVAGAAMVGASTAVGALIFGSIKLAARVETLGVVTERLGKNVGLTKDEVEDLVESIRKQGITLQASRAAFARMIQSNIDFTRGSELARLAQDAAVIANINSSEAFERLVFVITSGNVRMARNLGLQVSFQAAYEQLGKQIGKTSVELTQQEKIQARTNAVMAAGVNIAGSYEAAMETAGKKVLSLDRHLEESRRILGEVWLPAYATAVDAVTNSLKKWESLDEASQRATATTVGQVTALTGLGGALLLILPKFAGVVQSATATDLSMKALTISTLAWTAAIAAVAIAGVKLIQFINETDERSEVATKAVEEHGAEILETAKNYNEYATEIDRVNQLTDDNRILGVRLVVEQEKLTEQQFLLNREVKEADERMIRAGKAMIAARDGAEDLRTEEEKLADAELAAARAAEIQKRNTDFLNQSMSDLSLTIDTDIEKSAEEFQESLADLDQQLVDLETEKIQAIIDLETEGLQDAENAEEAVERLNNQRGKAVTRLEELKDRLKLAELQQSMFNDETSESTRLAKEQQISRTNQDIEDQKIKIGELTEEIKDWNEGTLTATEQQSSAMGALETDFTERQTEIREQIEETKQAFSDQTARMIFDLAQQRFAIGGLTREEIEALRDLAGPEGLGLIDETAVALLEGIDALAEDLEKPGDQSDIVADQLGDMFAIVRDGTGDIDDMRRAIEELPVLDLVAVRTAQGDEIFIPRGTVEEFIRGGREHGGPVERGKARIVGEGGPELFMPGRGGSIVPTTALAQMFRAQIPTPDRLGGTTNITNNTENTLNLRSQAPVENIRQDFEMMRALSNRRRA